MKLKVLKRGVRVRVEDGVYFTPLPHLDVIEVDDELGRFLNGLSAYSEIIDGVDEGLNGKHDKIGGSETPMGSTSNTTPDLGGDNDVVNLLSDIVNGRK